MNGDVIVKIGTILIALVGAIMTYIITPYVKLKTTEKQRDDIHFWVWIAVSAAEQMKDAGILEIPRKSYVLDFLNEKGIDINEKQLNALIEAAVYEKNKEKDKSK